MAARGPVPSSDLLEKNLETYSLIWLDSTSATSKDLADAQKQLRKQIQCLKTFCDAEQCKTYIQSLGKEERVIFVVSYRLAREVIPEIHSLQQILSVYLYAFDKRVDDTWVKPFSKVSDTTLRR